MNAELQRQTDAWRASRQRMGHISLSAPPVVKVHRPRQRVCFVYGYPIGPRPRPVVSEMRLQPVAPYKSAVIIDDVCARYEVTPLQLRSRRKSWPLPRARQEAAYRLYAECGHLSLSSIGRLLGGKHHTTILHGIRAYAERNGLAIPRQFEEAT